MFYYHNFQADGGLKGIFRIIAPEHFHSFSHLLYNFLLRRFKLHKCLCVCRLAYSRNKHSISSRMVSICTAIVLTLKFLTNQSYLSLNDIPCFKRLVFNLIEVHGYDVIQWYMASAYLRINKWE